MTSTATAFVDVDFISCLWIWTLIVWLDVWMDVKRACMYVVFMYKLHMQRREEAQERRKRKKEKRRQRETNRNNSELNWKG